MQKVFNLLAVVLPLLLSAAVVQAEPFGRNVFRTRWERTDLPVQRNVANRSWVWGPEPFTEVLMEPYADGIDGQRTVQYLDKSRMEINDPNAPPSRPWFVTNGLLVTEMIRGEIQVGQSEFTPSGPANIPIAGDPDNDFPTYAGLARLFGTPAGYQPGEHVTRVFLPEGAGEFPQYAGAVATEIVQVEQGFGIPRAFWNYMNQQGVVYRDGNFIENQPLFEWVYVLGYPVTDAYWTRVRVGNVERDVMFQAFERRILTYTPSNAGPWQVEMGNVGRQYYEWRYGE